MSEEQNVTLLMQYWLEKSKESLESARQEISADRLSFAVNRLYYACFYSASAALLMDHHTYKKHSGVRTAFHRSFIKTTRVHKSLGRLYDELFEARQRGDYLPFVTFEKAVVDEWQEQSDIFVQALSNLIQAQNNNTFE